MSCPKLDARSQQRTLVGLLTAAVSAQLRHLLVECIGTSSQSNWQSILTRGRLQHNEVLGGVGLAGFVVMQPVQEVIWRDRP